MGRSLGKLWRKRCDGAGGWLLDFLEVVLRDVADAAADCCLDPLVVKLCVGAKKGAKKGKRISMTVSTEK